MWQDELDAAHQHAAQIIAIGRAVVLVAGYCPRAGQQGSRW